MFSDSFPLRSAPGLCVASGLALGLLFSCDRAEFDQNAEQTPSDGVTTPVGVTPVGVTPGVTDPVGGGTGGDGAVPAVPGAGGGPTTMTPGTVPGPGETPVIETQPGIVPAECSSFNVVRASVLPDPAENPEVQQTLSALNQDQKIRLMYGWEGCDYGRGFECFTNQGVPEAGVPDWIMHDGPRGVRTLASITASTTFPTSVARAASFDLDLERRIGDVIGIEALAQKRDVHLAPAIDTLRHPQWGRAQEVYGEDPVLLGNMGAALVNGLQQHVPACIKHFTANTTDDNRTTMNAQMEDEQTLRENYTRQFRIAIEKSDPSCVMAAYNKVNGTFSAENAHLLTNLLRTEWGWKGFVVSDWAATQSTGPAVNAGLDLEMPNAVHFGRLGTAVQSGEVSGVRIDEAVARTLNVRYHWNQMSAEHQNRAVNPGIVDTVAHRELALEAALKGMVLLSNQDSLLPFSANQQILVVGPDGDAARLGDRGSSEVDPKPEYRTTPFGGLSARAVQAGATVDYQPSLAGAVAAAPGYDAVVLVVSMEHTDEGEGFNNGGDRENLHLDGPHPKLWPAEKPRAWITQLAAANPNLVVVLNVGSAVVEPSLAQAKALLYSFYPGQAGGTALASLLFGDVNFSGKLPFTVATDPAHYPEFGNGAAEALYGYYHGYRKFDVEGLVPQHYYGAGISYTTYEYSNIRVPCTSGVSSQGLVVVEVDVTNTGAVAGTEIVQLYVGYPNTAARRPVKELKAFTRVDLAAGETKTVQLTVPAADLAYFNMATNTWDVEAVEHLALVGPSADPATLLSAPFSVVP